MTDEDADTMIKIISMFIVYSIINKMIFSLDSNVSTTSHIRYLWKCETCGELFATDMPKVNVCTKCYGKKNKKTRSELCCCCCADVEEEIITNTEVLPTKIPCDL